MPVTLSSIFNLAGAAPGELRKSGRRSVVIGRLRQCGGKKNGLAPEEGRKKKNQVLILSIYVILSQPVCLSLFRWAELDSLCYGQVAPCSFHMCLHRIWRSGQTG